MRSLLKAMVCPPVLWNAIRVSLVVGTCLNAINQGANVWHGAPVDWFRLALNYAVPLLVASYSGAKVVGSGGTGSGVD